MSTTVMPRQGDTVRALDIPLYQHYEGTIVTITGVSPDGTMRAEFPSKQKPDDTLSLGFNRYEWPDQPEVKVGDKILTTDVPSVPHANGKVATVTRVFESGGKYIEGGRSLPYVEADFTAYTDDDGIDRPSTNWCVWGWEKAPITFETKDMMIGKKVKVIYASGRDRSFCGEVHEVVDTYHMPESNIYGPKVDRITVGIRVEGSHQWVQAYEVVEETPAEEEYVPSVGDRVSVTGYLADEGVTRLAHAQIGQVTSVDKGVWGIHVASIGHIVSGPGYVYPTPAVADGATLTVSTDEGRQAELERQLARANERVTEYSDRAGKFERDFARYAERVMQEAIDRDWCEEYERIMRDISDDLEIAEIPERRKNRVQVRRRVRGVVYRDVSVWVDEDDQYTTDPDEMYDERDSEDALGEDWVVETLDSERENLGGWDETEVIGR